MMRIAVSSEGPTLDDLVDPRFGRAGGFVVLETKSNAVHYIENGSSQVKNQGAGIETAERLSAAGVGVVLSGYVGPKAFAALQAADIAVYQDVGGMTVRAAIDLFVGGKLSVAEASGRP